MTALVAACCCTAWAGGAGARAQSTWRVNVDSAGNETSRGSSLPPSTSADGRFTVFSSGSDALVAGDSYGSEDVFVHDLQTGTTECVSVDLAGIPAGSSYPTSISSDGRFVAFQSDSSSLVVNDTNQVTDSFIRDRQSGTTELVSIDPNGVQFTDWSYPGTMSADGRFVTITTWNDPPFHSETWLRDRRLGTTEEVGVDSAGQRILRTFSPSVSADGRFVAFSNSAASGRVWVRDRSTGLTEVVSLDVDGNPSTGYSYWPSISVDGRFVVFESDADDLVPGDVNSAVDVFVRDRQRGTTELVSVGLAGSSADSWSAYPSISADGRRIAFVSGATNLVAGDVNGVEDIFVRDRWTQSTEMVSVTPSGNPGDHASPYSSISSGGRFVAFTSWADDLVGNDTNGDVDIFLRDCGPLIPAAGRVEPDRAPHDATIAVTILGSGFLSGSQPAVFVGGQPATNVVVVDDGTITCTTPVNAPGPADLTIQNSLGSSVRAGLFTETPAVLWSGRAELGGVLSIDYLVDPLDGVFAIAGAPPAVSIPTPPFDGELRIAPFFRLFFVPPGIWPYDVLASQVAVPSDPALSGTTFLLQSLSGPSFTGHPRNATWTNCAEVTIR